MLFRSIERKFILAGAWCFAASILSAVGFMHAYRYQNGDTVLALGQRAWPWAIGYAVMGISFVSARWITEPTDHGH